MVDALGIQRSSSGTGQAQHTVRHFGRAVFPSSDAGGRPCLFGKSYELQFRAIQTTTTAPFEITNVRKS